MANVGWSIPIDKLTAKLGANVEIVTRKIVYDLFMQVVQRSPVDTGRFRANWNVSYGEPSYAFTENTDENRVTAELGKVSTVPLGGMINLSNGLPYAHRLELGWSDQAPGGMVRVSLQETETFVRKALAS